MSQKKQIFVTKPSMPPYEEYIEKIKQLWDSAWLTNNGCFHRELEERLEQYLRIEKLALITNGHMALETAIQAMELTGEAITTPFTFVSTAHAIVRSGLCPVFCDISPDTGTMDTEKLESLITERTSAIIPVHVYGQVCEMEKIQRIADRHNLKVIYDAAHAFGECYQGKSVAAYGDASIFSFHATKVFHTVEGGAVVYRDKEYGRKLERLRNFGICSEETVDTIGGNAKMDEFRAIMGLCNLEHIEEEIGKRKKIIETYRALLGEGDAIRYFREQPGVKSNYAYFPIIISDKAGCGRDEIYRKLKAHGVFTRKYFYPLITDMDCYKKDYSSQDTPVAAYMADHVLTLPLYAQLELEDVKIICQWIKEMIK